MHATPLAWAAIYLNLQLRNIGAFRFETAVRNGDLMEIRRVVVHRNGTVRTIINFSLRTFCEDSDFKNFPDDVYKCCYQIEPHFNQVTEFLVLRILDICKTHYELSCASVRLSTFVLFNPPTNLNQIWKNGPLVSWDPANTLSRTVFTSFIALSCFTASIYVFMSLLSTQPTLKSKYVVYLVFKDRIAGTKHCK